MFSHGWKRKVAASCTITLMVVVHLTHSKRQYEPTTTDVPTETEYPTSEGPPPMTPPPTTPPPKPNKPHVILMVADDLGWNDVSWHNDYVVTPHLGQLAKEGVILNQSYVLPTCTPTRAALLSGRYPFTMGMQKGALNPLDPQGLPLSNKLLPKLLKKYGYTTHIIGKWHLGFCSWLYTPTRRGFDTFYGFYGGAEDYYTHKRNLKRMRREVKRGHGGKGVDYLDLRNNTKPDETKKGVYSTYVFAAAAEELIRSRNPQTPMFLYLPFQSVHGPLQVPKNYSRVFSKVGDYYRRNYLGMVMAMDDVVGRVVAALKETGHYDNSVIIFTTDNGGSIKMGASNYPLRGGKSNLLEGGTRGPAFVHSPLLPNPGTISNQLFHVTDWYRTVVGLAGGVAASPFLDSIDQWDAIAGYGEPPRDRLVYNIDDTKNKFRAAVRYNEFKLSVGAVGKKLWAPYRPVKYSQKELTLSLEDAGNSSWSEVIDEPKNCSESTTDVEFNSVISDFGEMTDVPDDAGDLSDEDVDSSISDLEDVDSSISDLGPSYGSVLDSSYSGLNSSWSEVNSSHSDLDFRRANRLLDPFVVLYGSKSKDSKNVSKGNRTGDDRISLDADRVRTKDKGLGKRPLLTPTMRRKENNSVDKWNKEKIDKKKRKKKRRKDKKKDKKKKKKDKKKKKKDKKKKNKRPPKRKKKPVNTKDEELWNLQSGFTRWWKIRSHAKIEWSQTVLKTLNQYLSDQTQIRLYNITADPVESTDLSLDNLDMVKYTMTYLAVQLFRFKSPKAKKRSSRGHPKYFDDVWTPGWCNAVQ